MRRLVIAIVLALSMLPVSAGDLLLDYYAVRIEVDEARSMHIKENFSVEYNAPVHGFQRDIQYRFPDGTEADLELLWSSSEVQTADNGTYLSIRFGDPDNLIMGGPYAYGIKYDYSLGADRYSDYDEFYYNIVTPGAWDSGIERLGFFVTFPHPVDPERIWLTAGPYGSEMELPFTLSDDGCSVSGRYSSLPEGYGVTLRVEMDDGFFSEAVRPFDTAAFGFWCSICLSAIMLAAAFLVWWFRGRDEKLIYGVRYMPPEGLSAMDAGFVYNGDLENSAVSAMLVYWADKGFVEIEDRGDDDFLFTRLSELPDSTPEAERQLFNAFFQTSHAVDTKGLRKSGFAAKLSSVRNAESRYFTGERSLSSRQSEKLQRLMMGLLLLPVLLHAITATLVSPGFMTLFILVPSLMAYSVLRSASRQIERKMRRGDLKFSYFAFPVFWLVFIWFFMVSALSSVSMSYRRTAIETAVFLLSLLLSMLLAASIERRSAYADEVLSSVMGYREFLEKAEKDRIEKLSSEDPEFFYHVLPYAMAMGVEDRWVRAFSGIYVQPARWYHGPDAADIYVLSSFARRWNHAYASSIAPRSAGHGGGARTTRGSSGFSGGGFSGGGGRSW